MENRRKLSFNYHQKKILLICSSDTVEASDKEKHFDREAVHVLLKDLEQHNANIPFPNEPVKLSFSAS